MRTLRKFVVTHSPSYPRFLCEWGVAREDCQVIAMSGGTVHGGVRFCLLLLMLRYSCKHRLQRAGVESAVVSTAFCASILEHLTCFPL
mmetsp:Transcript_14221/g.39358  ORF Transcript_14221/g.39358 Transcript_14221/m.39358 type:complete len:88 (+) Transcript_14221:914-1177(+)